MIRIGDYLSDRTLITDGATGTVLDQLAGSDDFERALSPLVRPQILARLHGDYLAAGSQAFKTATFGASARELASAGYCAHEDSFALSGRICLEAGRAARRVADEARSADGVYRFVAGSVGPGSAAPCLGNATFGELVQSYQPQMEAFIEAGVDFALIETVQDTLQAKAAIMALYRAGDKTGVELPFVVSATLDPAGRMLCGATARSFAAIMTPFKPAALGINCSGGPHELAKSLEELSACCSLPLSFMPNAGIPVMVNGSPQWPMGPEEFARTVAGLAERYGVAMVGGCCGSGPRHVAALAAALASRRPLPQRPERVFELSSVGGRKGGESGFLVIDERANASGSAAFRSILKAENRTAAVQFIVDRAALGADGVDLCVAGAPGDEAELFAELARQASPLMDAALSLDSLNPQALEGALSSVGGKPLVNSVNLEDPERALSVLRLIRRHGAAVVLLAVDHNGPARSAGEKLAVCDRLYELAKEAGLADQDLAFDLCTMPAAAGDDRAALETLRALSEIKKAHPLCATVLGVGNVSFGLPKTLRPAFTARFLAMARQRGLDAAIVDSSIPSLGVDEGPASLIDAALAGGGADAFSALLDAFNARSGIEAEPEAKGLEDGGRPLETLSKIIEGGRLAEATEAGRAAGAQSAEETELARVVTDAMLRVAARFDQGKVALPVVMRSADAAKLALAAAKDAAAAKDVAGTNPAAKEGRKAAPTIVMATVRGDLHDIGKNLAALVFEAAGYRVLDLGTDRSPMDIALAAVEAGALAVGVSGLLTRSLAHMEETARALESMKCPALLLCGGAAVSEEYITGHVSPLRSGLTRYAKDPFQALPELARALKEHSLGHASFSPSAENPIRPCPLCGAIQKPGGAKKPGLSQNWPRPSDGSGTVSGRFSLEDLAAALDEHFVVRGRWKYPLSQGDEGRLALSECLASLKAAGLGQADYSYRLCTVKAKGADRRHFRALEGKSELPLDFLREAAGMRRSVADWFPDGSGAAAFCVTMGREAAAWAQAERKRGGSEAYVRAYGLLAGLAEAAAELCHRRVKAELKADSGKRYSFGFPACPGTEHNHDLILFTGAGAIGLSATESGELDPEFSVSAIVSPHPEAAYLS